MVFVKSECSANHKSLGDEDYSVYWLEHLLLRQAVSSMRRELQANFS
jgi:hypothetical protein